MMKIAARAVIDMERKSFNLPIKRRYLVNPEIMMENLMKELDVALKPEFPFYCNEAGGVAPSLAKSSIWCFVASPT